MLSSSPVHLKEEKNKLNSGTTPLCPCCRSRFDQLLRVLLPISHYSVLVQNPHLYFLI